MAGLVRNIPIASVNFRNLLPGIIILACIVALFFIPDILNFHVKREVRPIEVPQPPVIDEVLQSEVPAVLLREVEPTSYNGASSPLSEVLQSMEASAGTVQGEDQVARQGFQLPSTKPLRWEDFKSDAAQAAFNRARTEAQNILVELKETHAQTQRALLSMVAAIDLVNTTPSKLLTPRAAVDYLEAADVEVLAVLQEERVDRSFVLRWSEVSLAPAIESYRSERFKQELVNPFDPRLRLRNVKISKLVQPKKNSDPEVITRLEFIGVVQGKDIKKMKLYHNGVYVQELPFGQPDRNGYREFYFNAQQAYGNWTIRAWDTLSNEYLKTYRFFPMIERFPQVRQEYQLPFDPTIPEPRLDALFKIREIKGPSPDQRRPYVRF